MLNKASQFSLSVNGSLEVHEKVLKSVCPWGFKVLVGLSNQSGRGFSLSPTSFGCKFIVRSVLWDASLLLELSGGPSSAKQQQ